MVYICDVSIIYKCRNNMEVRNIEICAALLLNLIQYSLTDHILSCNSSLVGQCPREHDSCNATLQECVCMKGFVRVGDDCKVPPDESTSHSGVTVAIVTILTLALIITGIILIVRKYNLIDYIHQKMSRHRNDVMYEDVMIGNDDPPLSP